MAEIVAKKIFKCARDSRISYNFEQARGDEDGTSTLVVPSCFGRNPNCSNISRLYTRQQLQQLEQFPNSGADPTP
jgi:hypothetical protein